MQQSIAGIHHITAMAADPQRNVDFYVNVLGQRLVKTTVNFDDPGTYHLYYGDETGTPGTVLTFFPWPGARRGQRGVGEVAATAYAVPPGSLPYWQARLASFGHVASAPQTRFGETLMVFQDPDGMVVELVETPTTAATRHWNDGPVPVEMAAQGFHSATLWVASLGDSLQLLTDVFGWQQVGQEGSRVRVQAPISAAQEAAGGGLVGRLDLVVLPNQARGRLGAGSVHHIAFRTEDDAAQLAWRRALSNAGFGVTPVQDRQYFHSIYFREPAGVLYEIATNPPGFTWDEPVAELGSSLKLPPWLEPQRAQIERVLPPIERPATPVTAPAYIVP